MALLTTTPARLMTPIPVMIIPNGVPVTSRPINTPTSDSTTDVKLIKGVMKELNWVSKISRIMAIQAKNALLRNAW
jgi:hypothetical protein